jgi:hypothetical protein
MPEQEKHHCNVENAPRFLDWIRNRGGVAIWRSVNLSNPGASWSSPATIRKGDCEGQTGDEVIPYPKPNWQCESQPTRVITSTDDVLVYTDKEVKRFRVALRCVSAFQIKCSDASSKKIRKAVEAAGKGAHYVFDYETQEAVILAPTSVVSLTEWARAQEVAA